MTDEGARMADERAGEAPSEQVPPHDLHETEPAEQRDPHETEPAEKRDPHETELTEQRDPHETELAREALTMALYVSLSLIAVLIALPAVGHVDNRVEAGITVLVTAIGLVLAHHVAFRMSTRLVNGGLLTPESIRALKAQAIGGLPVALIAALPVFVFGEDPGEDLAILLLLAFVAIVGYRSARFTSGKARSFLYVCGLVIVVAAVLTIKLLAGH